MRFGAANESIQRALGGRNELSGLTLGTLLWPLTGYARQSIADVAALPELTNGQMGHATSVQTKGFMLALGNTAVLTPTFRPAAEVLGFVFGVESMHAHMLFRRLGYALALD